MKKFGFILLMLATLALSCTREPSPVHDDSSETVFKTIHYKAQVSTSDDSKATTADNDTKYVFQATDSLYVSSTDPVSGDTLLFGVLKLIYGSGETTAYFEGDLVGVDEFEPASDTPINVTLVSDGDRIHTTGGGKVTGTAYPSNEYGTSLADAVQKFSHFTCSTTFGATRFTLTQQSAFLVFSVKFLATELASGTSVTARINNDINSTNASLMSGPISATTLGVDHTQVVFVAAFPGGTTSLNDAELSLTWGANPEDQKRFGLNNADLAANNYYTISRTTIVNKYAGFRIIALANGTITGSNFTTLEYTLNEGDSWQSYTSGIDVQAGDEVCFRAGSADATDDGTHHKTIVSNSNFKVAGDIASLLTGADFGTQSATIPNAYTFVNFFTDCTQLTDASGLVFSMPKVPGSALKSFFDGCSNLVAGPAELAATTIGSTCYRNMFKGCSSLTSAPIIRQPTTYNGDKWYQQMFRGCSSLHEIVFLDTRAYSSGNFTDWVNGINATGTFYVADINNNPFGNNRGNSAIPSGWTVTDYVEPTP
ncbi:MAG: hypothetical protein IJL22_00525 [Bacteroidales bacterium]|nr:hypothetical protein [Bacteroidales bacterium]